MNKFNKRKLFKRGMTILLAASMMFGSTMMPSVVENNVSIVHAAESIINSMNYYSTNDGPVLTGSGVGSASYGFVMPIFNGGASSWEDVSSDLSVKVKVDGTYTDIDEVSDFIYNQNWGHWNDGGFTGYWFKVSETTNLQLYSKATGVSLDYTLNFTNINTTTITSMTATDGPELTAGPTGSIGFTYPTFNGDSSIPYAAVADDLKVYVKTLDSSEWIDIDNNAASGWIYDDNFGQFTDGPGGYWFTLTESINVKLESKSSGAYLIYTLNYNKGEKSSYTLTAYDSKTTFTADDSGAIGLALPKIGGSDVYESDLENFVYEVKIDGSWVELSDYSRSTFSYSGNGYNKLSEKNQWGYWVDYIYGLWFQPIQQDYEIRIGYPENGEKGGAINNNYVYYTFVGNPDAPRPTPPDDNFVVGDPNTTAIEGWELVFNDEFSGNSLDTSTWNYVTGYYINDDPGTWGWGNNELEHYTDSEKNVYVSDGKLNITAFEEPKSFPQDPSRVAPYSSGKITTQDKFSFKYGRIDFRAKLPEGNGLWPALWLLPDDDTYGTWAASGEIDVMEARGRLPGASSGAIHFGGTWPANTYIGGDYAFPDGQRIDTDYHMYSLVWEEDMLKWYVDGNLFFYATSDQWYTTASSAKGAPFDQEFYIIMNLAVGGWFDGGITPEAGDIPATMQVDYVRVYKAEGDTSATHSGSSGAGGNIENDGTNNNTDNKENTETEENTPDEEVTITDQVGDGTVGFNRTNGTLDFYVNGATFADIHYKVNNGGQINVGMTNDGNGNFTYTVDGLNIGDTIEYSFTYNPGNGALDTAWASYELTSEAGDSQTGESSGNDGNTNNSGSSEDDKNTENKEETTDKDTTITDQVGDGTVGFNRTNGTLNFYVNGATFADIHYKINNGGQINVGMTNDGNGNFTYTVENLNVGDTIEYSFTYNPGNGALDTTWSSYTLTSESGNTDSNDSGNTAGGSSAGTSDYSDKPELRTDIAPRDEQMFFQFNNETNGAYSDNEIYWSILGFHPETGKLCYVDKDGNLIPATTALNTISKGDRMCADVFYTLAEKDYVYMPDIVSGRMYISYGSPVYVTINSDVNGNVGFAGPDLNNTSDPNQDVYFEFIEFTITNGEYWGNTTRVDFFSFPVVSRLVGDGGFISTPGDADVYDKTVGDIGTRDEIFAAFKSEVPAEFQTLIQAPYRIMAPCKATFNEGGQYENYFDAYIDEIWNKFTSEDLVFNCQAGTFRGRTNGNSLIFSQNGGESNIVVNKPTTQDAFEGKGTLATGTSIEKVVEAQLCAAINRGVALTPDKWSDSSAFYQSAPANFYSKFFHDHSVDGLAYGFCYDDVFDYSTLLHYTEPTALVIDLKW